MRELANIEYNDIDELFSSFPFEQNDTERLVEELANIIVEPSDNLVNSWDWQEEAELQIDPCYNPDKVISVDDILLTNGHITGQTPLKKITIQNCTGLCQKGDAALYCQKHSTEFAMNLLMQEGSNGSKDFDWYGRYMAKIVTYLSASPKIYHKKLCKLLSQELKNLMSVNGTISRRNIPLSIADIYKLSSKLTPKLNNSVRNNGVFSNFIHVDSYFNLDCNHNRAYSAVKPFTKAGVRNSERSLITDIYKRSSNPTPKITNSTKKKNLFNNFTGVHSSFNANCARNMLCSKDEPFNKAGLRKHQKCSIGTNQSSCISKNVKATQHKRNDKKILFPMGANLTNGKIVPSLVYLSIGCLPKLVVPVRRVDSMKLKDILPDISPNNNVFNCKINSHYLAHKNRFGRKLVAQYGCKECAFKNALNGNALRVKAKNLFCFDCNVIPLGSNIGLFCP